MLVDNHQGQFFNFFAYSGRRIALTYVLIFKKDFRGIENSMLICLLPVIAPKWI
jgi:hypothetical protein